MNIRFANKNDDAKVLAKLIYETDVYIYPYWFDDKSFGIEQIAKLIKNPDSIFYYENCVVAEVDAEIIGVIMFYKNDGSYNCDYNDISSISFESAHVIHNYVLDLQNQIKDNTYYVFAVRVEDGFLRQGVACKMFDFVFSSVLKNSIIEIDVLKDNIPALNLYKKVGFKIVKEYKGYNGYKKRKPLCYSMLKVIK